MLNRTFDQQRFSPLDQINKGNVGQLRMAWSRGLPAGTQESMPIVYRGIMYLFAPGATIQAVDATNGDLIWEYQRDYPQGVNPRAARNKSLGIYEDMIFFAAPDGFLLALDAATGKLRWETKVDEGGQTAGGILVADGKVITNRTCIADVRRETASSRRTTPRPARRSGASTPRRRPASPAATPGPTCRRSSAPPVRGACPAPTIPSASCSTGASPIPNPYTRLKRHGRHDAVSFTAPANLYSNSTLALDVATGKLAWYYQELPGDDWDADHNQERILTTTRVNPDPKHVKWISSALPRNEEREVIVTVGEGGGMFVLDQETGRFLWANPFPYDDPNINMDDIDLKTGTTSVNPDKLFKKDGDKILGCYHNTRGLWSIAYHPEKNAVYVPFQDQCLSMTANMKTKVGWGPRAGVMRPGIDPDKFMNIAKIDISTGEMKILYSQPQAGQGSALVTAGDLVFWGDMNRRFRAFDADSGKVLWESIVGGMVMNSTITYAVNGKQYVMIFTGEGQSVSAGPLSLTQKSMAKAVRGHNSIFVFALP